MNEEKPDAARSTTPPGEVQPAIGNSTEFQEQIRQARGGGESAFDALMRGCRDYLLLVANQELGTNLRAKLGASDIVQSVCLLAHQNIGQFRGETKQELLAWLRVILRNEVLATHRRFTAGKRNVNLEQPADGAAPDYHDSALRTPSSEAIVQEEAAALRLALGRLASDHRRVILLRNWERLPFDEIAERMGRSTDATKKLWARSVAQLRRELSNGESQSGG